MRHNNLLVLTYPALLVVVVIVLTAVPLRFPYMSQIIPSLVLMIIYYWCLYRPELLPYIVVFLAGLLQDALTGMPFGLHSLLFVLLKLVVGLNRSKITEAPFIVTWGTFAMLIIAYNAAIWSLLSFVSNGVFLSVSPVLVQLLLTIAIYPAMHSFCNIFLELIVETNKNA